MSIIVNKIAPCFPPKYIRLNYFTIIAIVKQQENLHLKPIYKIYLKYKYQIFKKKISKKHLLSHISERKKRILHQEQKSTLPIHLNNALDLKKKMKITHTHIFILFFK